MRTALAIIILFCARFATASWFDPRLDADIAWQQWLGLSILHNGHLPAALGPETFTSAGAYWVPQEWALSLAVALTLGTALFPLLAATTVIAGGSVLLFTALAARRLGASSFVTLLCVTCVGYSMVESYGIRAQVFGWASLAAVMFVLRCGRGRAIWWIVPLTALWANLHASAMLSPALLAVWTAGIALEERAWTPRVRRYTVLTIASAAAVCATPLGIHLPLYAAQLFTSPIRHIIQEWQPTDLTASSFVFGAFPLIVAGCIWGIARRSRDSESPYRWREAALFASSTWLVFSALRNIPVCAIVIAPVVAQSVSRVLPEKLRVNQLLRETPMVGVLNGAALAGAIIIALRLSHLPDFYQSKLPYSAIAAVAAVPGSHNLYCEDFAWCGIALQYPNLREFIDGRCDPFPLPVWEQYQAVYLLRPQWRQILQRNGVTAILVGTKRPLARAMTLRKDWRSIYTDARYEVFVKRPLGAAATPRAGLAARL
jgi:hypothetical protein